MPHHVIYARKSTESEDRQILSIDSQITELRRLAEKRNIPVVKIYTESQSAKEPGRPVFNEVMKLVNKGKINGIFCWKIDRLARNPVDEASVRWAVKKNGLNVITPARDYNLEQDNSILSSLEFAMAEKYIDDLSKNVRRGNRAKMEQGGWPGLAPIGYLNDTANLTVVRDPERFPLIRKMWDLLLSGKYSVEEILNRANSQWGLRTRKTKRTGGKPLSRSALYELFSNPFYCGLMVRGTESFWGKHEPMISQKEFDIAQSILGRDIRPKSKKHTFAFTGLIKCGECGCSITAEAKTKRTKSGNVHHYTYYRCTKKRREVFCSQKCLEERKMEEQVVQVLEKLHLPDRIVSWAHQYLTETAEEEKGNLRTVVESLEKALNDCRSQLDRLTQMRLRDLLTDEEYLGKKTELLRQAKELEEKLNNPEIMAQSWLEPAKQTFSFANQAKNWFLKGNSDEKRRILETVGSNLILKDRILLMKVQKPFLYFEKRLSYPTWSGFVDDIRTWLKENAQNLRLPQIKKPQRKSIS